MHIGDPLFTAVVLLSAGVLGLAVSHFARLSPIVGFFILGASIGPQALGLVDNHSPTIEFLGELGVSFLLFDIGLHLSLKELRRGWRQFFFAGVAQFAAVTCALAVVAKSLGLSWATAILLGAVFSLSSTALVLKILSDEREDTSPVGKRATEVLVFQDIAAILLLVVLSGDLASGISPLALALPLLKMSIAAVVVVAMGRLALKPLFRLLISLKSDEVITAFALLLVFLASWATASAGLSLALGAFLGGLALSESNHSYLVRGEVAPFRSLLLSLFFLSVGINLDIVSISANLWTLVLLLSVFSVIKILANIVAFRLARIEKGVATLLSFLLAQGSEFAFVLLGTAFGAGLVDAATLSLGVSVVGLSLAVTPLLASLGCYFSRSVCSVGQESDASSDDPREVIIVRMDEFGRQIAGLLEAERIPYRGHDHDLERLSYAKSRGLNVFYSDVNRPRTLGRASLGKVLAVVCLVEDEHILRVLIEGLNKIDVKLPLVAASESPARIEFISSLGVEQSFIKNESSILAVYEALIRSLGFETERVDEMLSRALKLLEPEDIFPRMTIPDESLAVQAAAA